ncbi:TetR/AcrR family transcriptional regulator [Streptomyces sp. KPB2]|jgi:AcrR family transcriptional regulator|uniref:TetR/AcrR family transcriptional regulator n=1 Tax=Streptomyces TaxID=1883 RepID=UPI000F6CBEC6|nr:MULTISPECIES: TetR/AcrR family transcriptional regulator [Streptomyces]WSU00732.1 TetR/AcrR family transcriptional regulator [Streptomyces sp. NBC_01124]AZM75000.1 TetR/AcrR family transcriptional regulator [Streptomyces sp. KPB2]MBH5134209.1 helix-turn-helix transcriptional regulator [Streptomyces sp. HB-N217]MDU0256824.1 helix-turn-helix domain-containing protein [Streptomyces sp. PU10]QKW60515.1 helix-turn-helix transcriptional regulator [Streptomyces sp. NA03103]
MAEDRRTRRSRRALGTALVELVLERGFTALTVEDITERADVARATFYAHFRDKEDLFARVTDDLLAGLAERLAPAMADSAVGFTGKPVLEMLRHAREERDLYRIVLRGEGDGKPLQMFADACARVTAEEFRARAERNAVEPRIDPELLARVWVGEQLGVLRWWVEQETPSLPAEEVVRMLLDLAMRGRYWASGFEPSA